MSTYEVMQMSRLIRVLVTLAEVAKGFDNHERRNQKLSVIRTIIQEFVYRYPTPSQEQQDIINIFTALLSHAVMNTTHKGVRHNLSFFVEICTDTLEMLKHREANPNLSDSDIRYFRWSDPQRLCATKEVDPREPYTTP